ncbi:MAG: DUF4230 domain-containing protein [Eubacterium sp.]|nr:DUF4230 domain-containing protein [Eubacterium sp.]
MKNKKVSIVVVVFVVLAMSVAGYFLLKPEKVVEEEELSLSSIKNITELATYECVYHNTAEYDDKGDYFWEGDSRLWIEYSGTVKLGIRADKIDMKVDGNKVTISLPQAEVLGQGSIDKDSLTEDSYFSEKGNIFAKDMDAEVEAKALANAQSEMEKEARSDTATLKAARERAKLLIENQIKKIGQAQGKEYKIEFVDA